MDEDTARRDMERMVAKLRRETEALRETLAQLAAQYPDSPIFVRQAEEATAILRWLDGEGPRPT